MDGMMEGVGRRTEEGDWRTGSCRNRTEVTGGRADNRPSLITGGGKKLVFECYSCFCSNQFIFLFNLKNRWGEGQPHVVNNGVGGWIGWSGKRFS